MGGVAVRGETLVDEAALCVREELGRFGVVVDKPVCAEGNQDRGYPFLRSGQSTVRHQDDAKRTRMKIQRQPLSHTTPAMCPIPCEDEGQLAHFYQITSEEVLT